VSASQATGCTTGSENECLRAAPQISDTPSPIADLEHPYAFSRIDKDILRRMFQIGDRRLRIAETAGDQRVTKCPPKP
jgi:hypothetical protein